MFSKLTLKRHLREMGHFELMSHCAVRIMPVEFTTREALNAWHQSLHAEGHIFDHRHHIYGDPKGPCAFHSYNPRLCPSAHVCAHCGGTLAVHYGPGAACPVGARNFYPDAATLDAFPQEYEKNLI